jgi:predicted nucleotidyltransferase
LECGGKRSATPLSCRTGISSARAVLPVGCHRTSENPPLVFVLIRRFVSLDLNTRFPHLVGMVKRSDIIEYANEVARQFQPERIILFGSYAEGRATVDSDVDLFVEMNHAQSSLQQALTIRKAIKRTFPLDLVVKKPREIQQRLQQNDFFLKTIMDRGQVLYERAG